MFRAILLLLIFGGIFYLLFEKFSADKTNGEHLYSSVGAGKESSIGALRVIRAVMQENYDYENK